MYSCVVLHSSEDAADQIRLAGGVALLQYRRGGKYEDERLRLQRLH